MSKGCRVQHPLKVSKLDDVLEELQDRSEKDLLIEILIELKKINIQLQMATDEEIKDYDTE